MASNYCNNKAGMASLDMNKIRQIIAENTNQEFFSHERKIEKQIEERVFKNRELLNGATQGQLHRLNDEANHLTLHMEQLRSLRRLWVHIDMDAFYASVESRDNPSLRNIPFAVGGDAMLCTSNYAARKFGVRSAMPGFIAKKLCPQLVVVPPNMSKYTRESDIIRKIFDRYDPNLFMGSLDEAYLDITEFIGRRTQSVKCKRVRYTGDCVCRLPLLGSNEELAVNLESFSKMCKRCGKERIILIDTVEFGTGLDDVVQQIRFEVQQATGLTCSAGIAANKILAKICTDFRKPDGQFRLNSDRERILEMMWPLAIRKVPGIGSAGEAVLKALGAHSCQDLFDRRAFTRFLFSKLYSEWLLQVSLGLSDSIVFDQEDLPKSTSVGWSFKARWNRLELFQILQRLSKVLFNSLGSSRIVGGRIATLVIKFATFEFITRCKQVDFVIRDIAIFYSIVEGLLKKEIRSRKVAIRMLGVRLSKLVFEGFESAGETIQKKQKTFPIGCLQMNLWRFLGTGTGDSIDVRRVDNSLGELFVSEEEEEEENEANRSVIVLSSCTDELPDTVHVDVTFDVRRGVRESRERGATEDFEGAGGEDEGNDEEVVFLYVRERLLKEGARNSKTVINVPRKKKKQKRGRRGKEEASRIKQGSSGGGNVLNGLHAYFN